MLTILLTFVSFVKENFVTDVRCSGCNVRPPSEDVDDTITKIFTRPNLWLSLDGVGQTSVPLPFPLLISSRLPYEPMVSLPLIRLHVERVDPGDLIVNVRFVQNVI